MNHAALLETRCFSTYRLPQREPLVIQCTEIMWISFEMKARLRSDVTEGEQRNQRGNVILWCQPPFEGGITSMTHSHDVMKQGK